MNNYKNYFLIKIKYLVFTIITYIILIIYFKNVVTVIRKKLDLINIYDAKNNKIKYDKEYKNTWINLTNKIEYYPYPKMYYFENCHPEFYPEIKDILKLFTIKEKRSKLENTNTLLPLFAQFFVHTFLNTKYIDNVPYQGTISTNAGSIYGYTKDAENFYRTFINGKVNEIIPQIKNNKKEIPDILQPLNITGNINDDYYITALQRGNNNIYLIIFQTILLRNHNKLCDYIDKYKKNFSDEDKFQICKTLNLLLLYHFVIDTYVSKIANIKSITHFINIIGNSNSINNKNFITVPFEYNIIYQWHAMIPDKIADHNFSDLFYKPEILETKSFGYWLGNAIKEKACKFEIHNTPEFLMMTEQRIISILQQNKFISFVNFANFMEIKINDFKDITNNIELQNELKDIYKDVKNIDFYVGNLCYDKTSRGIFNDSIRNMLALFAFAGTTLSCNNFRDYLNSVFPEILYDDIFNKKIDCNDLLFDNLTDIEKTDLLNIIGNVSNFNFDIN